MERNRKNHRVNTRNGERRKENNRKNENSRRNEESQDNVVYGKNAVMEEIKNKDLTKVYLQKGVKFTKELDALKNTKIPYVYVEKEYLDSLTNGQNHQGIVALSSPVEYLDLRELIEKNKNVENPMILMLDEVQDPGNLGAILRIVDAFNINGVIINKRRNVQVNSTVVKVSTGASNYVDIVRVNNLRQGIKELKKSGYWISYLDMDGNFEANQVDYDVPLVVIIGGEDKGVTESIKKECDYGITIKMDGHVNSLNVASATSILCYQKKIFNQV